MSAATDLEGRAKGLQQQRLSLCFFCRHNSRLSAADVEALRPYHEFECPDSHKGPACTFCVPKSGKEFAVRITTPDVGDNRSYCYGYKLFVDGHYVDPAVAYRIFGARSELTEGFQSGGNVLTFAFAKPPAIDEDAGVAAMRGGGDNGATNEQGTVRVEIYEVEIIGEGILAASASVQNVPQLSAEARLGTDKKNVGSGLAVSGTKLLPSQYTQTVSGKYNILADVCSMTLRYYDQFRAQLRVDVGGTALIPIWTEKGYAEEAEPAPPAEPEEHATPGVVNSPPKRRRTEPRVKPEVVDLSRNNNTAEDPVVLSDSD